MIEDDPKGLSLKFCFHSHFQIRFLVTVLTAIDLLYVFVPGNGKVRSMANVKDMAPTNALFFNEGWGILIGGLASD